MTHKTLTPSPWTAPMEYSKLDYAAESKYY